jgi:hypothetical protein
MPNPDASSPVDFIRAAIEEDLRTGRFDHVHTRFPPEPNGYLHIGHTKALVIDFGIAREFGGKCNLRYDDTNPVKEDVEYVDAIKEDIHWLGFDWEDREFYASDYGRGVRWNDPAFGIVWPAEVSVISERDASYPDFTTLEEVVDHG